MDEATINELAMKYEPKGLLKTLGSQYDCQVGLGVPKFIKGEVVLNLKKDDVIEFDVKRSDKVSLGHYTIRLDEDGNPTRLTYSGSNLMGRDMSPETTVFPGFWNNSVYLEAKVNPDGSMQRSDPFGNVVFPGIMGESDKLEYAKPNPNLQSALEDDGSILLGDGAAAKLSKPQFYRETVLRDYDERKFPNEHLALGSGSTGTTLSESELWAKLTEVDSTINPDTNNYMDGLKTLKDGVPDGEDENMNISPELALKFAKANRQDIKLRNKGYDADPNSHA
jgi:hypothetical protein